MYNLYLIGFSGIYDFNLYKFKLTRKMPHTTKNDDAGLYMIGIKEMRK